MARSGVSYSMRKHRAAYELRAAGGRSWTAVAEEAGFPTANRGQAAHRGAQLYAQHRNLPWPIPITCLGCGLPVVTRTGRSTPGRALTCHSCKRAAYLRKYKGYTNAWKLANRARGLCKCGKGEPAPGRMSCARCLEQNRRQMERKRRAAGKPERTPQIFAERCKQAYELASSGRPWPQVAAEMDGERKGNPTLHVTSPQKMARKHAKRHGLPWPLHHRSDRVARNRRLAYEIGAEGLPWKEVAAELEARHGIKLAWQTLTHYARRHAEEHGLPWPLTADRNAALCEDRDRQAYEIYDRSGLAWDQVSARLGMTGRSALNCAKRHAKRHGLRWPLAWKDKAA